MSHGTNLIARERMRQIGLEGWTADHDDQHTDFELTKAALAYAVEAVPDEVEPPNGEAPEWWPWHESWWKPAEDPVYNLVKAGALIAAEIDRILRSRGDEE